MNYKQIITIGDIHGINGWKNIVNEYVDPATGLIKEDILIIFMGDYLDSFLHTNLRLLTNFNEIIELKKQNINNVVLLLGNHEIHYIVKSKRYGGYRAEMQADIYKVYNKNKSLFTFAYQHNTENSTILFTHAGVREAWYTEFIWQAGNLLPSQKNIRDMAIYLNLAWEHKLEILLSCSRPNGGYDAYDGPLWVRPDRLKGDYIPGLSQVVGHTETGGGKQWDKPDDDTILLFTDCLQGMDDLGNTKVPKTHYLTIKFLDEKHILFD